MVTNSIQIFYMTETEQNKLQKLEYRVTIKFLDKRM